MPRAYFLLALVALPPASGCVTRTYSGEPLTSPRYVEATPPSDAPPPASTLPVGPRAEAPVAGTAVPRPAAVTNSAVVPAPPPAASLVVANVHKEPVSVYSVRGDRLEFVAQVMPGDAVDLPVSAGARLAATFSQAPHCANYAAKGQPGEVWLLRPVQASPAPPPAWQPATGAPTATTSNFAR